MASIRIFLLGLALAAPAGARAQYGPLSGSGAGLLSAFKGYPAYTVGVGIGWAAPYGWGLEASHLLRPHLDVNAGLGFTINGGKIGVGSRYYFTPERAVSAFAGSSLSFSTGVERVLLGNDGRTTGNLPDELTVRYRPAALLHLQAGARWQPNRFCLLLTALTYGQVLTADPLDYRGATGYSRANQRQAQLLAPGGLGYSLGVALGIR